jgi:hypothetical protein
MPTRLETDSGSSKYGNVAVIPKADELYCWHSVQWQIQSFRGLSVGAVNWILPHWQRAFIPMVGLFELVGCWRFLIECCW